MNKVILMGRLTRDPETRYTQGQQPIAVASFSIAVDRKFKRDGQPEADFFSCSAFGKTGEFVEKYLKKGTKVVISGSIQNDNYKDKNGVDHYTTKIIVEEVEFAESKKAEQEASKPEASKPDDGFVNVPEGIDEDLPFAQPAR